MRKRLYLSGVAFCAAVAAAIAVEAAIGAAGQDAHAAGGIAQLQRELGPGVKVARSRETGRVRFVGSAPGRPIPPRPGLGAAPSPVAAARAFLRAYGGAFGLPQDPRALRVTAVLPGQGGGAAVRLQQEIDGVPVLAGELVVAVDARGNVLSTAGEVEPDRVDTRARIGAPEARRIAIAATAKGRVRGAVGLHATAPALAIHDTRLLGGPGLDRPALVWQTVVSSAGPGLRRLVLVDADAGVVTAAIDLVETAKDRRVCDAEESPAKYPCAAPYEREEGDPATGNADIDAAYDFAGDTYDFFSERFGRDSLDDAGLPLVSTVRSCPEGEPCPFENAFWDGEQMVYGTGFAAADDVVGHELSHGFTQFSSNLFYWYQSGAINESMSDVFGEYIDLTNGAGDDSESVRWLIGEDIPGIGAIRDMQNPPAFNDPDKMTSSRYVADPNQVDNGGVHTNSGVNNKAAYLIADGETFNGTTVTGIGIEKAARVYHDAETSLLTSGSDYADLYNALPQACTNAIGGTEGITVADCEEVTDAVTATEMNQQPLVAPAPEAPVCGAGEEPADLFFDDLENPASGNWTHSALSGEDGWYYPQNPNLFSWFDATYATSGKTNFWGYDVPSTSDYVLAQTSDLTVPAGAVYLRFDHSYAFEDATKPDTRYDGGQLEYSVDGGTTWQDAESLFTHNGYNGTITKKYDNPLKGQAAFTAESNGYISSRVDLSGLAGEDVRFRFRIGSDEIVDDYGWFIDDVEIYKCEEAEAPPDETPPETTIESGAEGPTNDSTPTFAFGADEEPVSFECAVDEGEFASCSSPHTTAPLPDGSHVFEVRATDAAENTDPSPAKREFTVDTEAPDPPESLATDPASPANANEPLVSGEAEPGSTVRLYAGADCEGTVLESGSAATFESPGLQASVANDSTTSFRAGAEDAAGNLSPCSSPVEYVEDSQAPETTIDSGPDPLTNLDSASFAFSGSDPGGSGVASFECRLDSSEESGWEACASPHPYSSLADGSHTFEVRATDTAENTDPSPAKREFTVDTQAPGAPQSLATDPASPANANEPLVSGEVEPGSTVRLYESGDCSGAAEVEGSAEGFASPGFTAAVPDNSAVQFSAKAEDAAGNVSPCSDPAEYVEDSQAPETTIDEGPEGLTADQTPTFDFSANEPGSSFECRIDAGGFASCTSPHTTDPLVEGAHTFEVRATDAAENADPSPAKREFTVEMSVPDEPPEVDEEPPSPQPQPDAGPSPLLPEPELVPADRTPPAAVLFGARRQIVGGAIVVRVGCDEPCAAIGRGRIVAWRPAATTRARQRRQIGLRLRRATRRLAANRVATLNMWPPNRRARRWLRRLVRGGWKARAVVRVRYVDAAGNAAVRRMIVVLRPSRRRS